LTLSPVHDYVIFMFDAMTWKRILLVLNGLDGIPLAALPLLRTLVEENGVNALKKPGQISSRAGIKPALAQKISALAWEKAAEEEENEIRRHRLDVVTPEDNIYPSNLRLITSPPPLLYVKGNLNPEDSRAVAIVGARRADFRGKGIAKALAFSLAKQGITVVSGLARGIDTQAHLGALAAGGRTIAVLGSGFSRFYPPENRETGEEIARRGAVISEFSCKRTPDPRNFPRRNRIISGLSLGVVVVQATRKSGSMITARMALEQGREVFAVPGPPESPLSHGCHALIKQGAKLVETVEDILEELNIAPVTGKDPAPGSDIPALKGISKSVYMVLNTQPMHLDALCQQCSLETKDVLPSLLDMELSGLIVRLPGEFYARKMPKLEK